MSTIATPRKLGSKKSQPRNNNHLHTAEYSDAGDSKQTNNKDINAKLKRIKKAAENTFPNEYSPKFVFEEYTNLLTLQKIPINNVWIEALAKELTNWAFQTKTAIRFDEFLHGKGMIRNEFMRLKNKSPLLGQAYEFALACIAKNREKGGASHEMNWTALASTQSHYCRIFKEEAQWRARLKDSDTDSGTKLVIMPSIEELEKNLLQRKILQEKAQGQ